MIKIEHTPFEQPSIDSLQNIWYGRKVTGPDGKEWQVFGVRKDDKTGEIEMGIMSDAIKGSRRKTDWISYDKLRDTP